MERLLTFLLLHALGLLCFVLDAPRAAWSLLRRR